MQEYYHVLTVRPSSHHELFKDFLSDTLPIAFEEKDDGSFVISSEEELDTIAWGLEQFQEALQKALGKSMDLELTLSKEKNSDWIRQYQESIQAIEIPPFYIHPTWNSPKEDKINIAIDPALAFGTGHHPTTASCLKAIASYVKKEQKVLDVGCGSGILAIAAAKLGAEVDACDTDGVSVENTLLNAKENEITLSHYWEGSVSMAPQKYDVVIANIVADVLVFIAKDLKKVLKPKGTLILSGILDKYEAKVLASYEDYEISERISQDEWVTLILTQRD